MEFSRTKRKGAVIHRACKLKIGRIPGKTNISACCDLCRGLVRGVLFLRLRLRPRSACLRSSVPELGRPDIRALGIHATVSPCTFGGPEATFQPPRRSTVRRIPLPEPMVAMEIVVAAADEKDVIGNTYGYVHLGLRQHYHCWRRVHNDGRWLADVDVYAHLGTGGRSTGNRRATPAVLRDKPLRPNMRYLRNKVCSLLTKLSHDRIVIAQLLPARAANDTAGDQKRQPRTRDENAVAVIRHFRPA